MGRRPRAAAGVQGAGRHAPGTAAIQAAPGHLRLGIGELKAPEPRCRHMPTRCFLPTWIPLSYPPAQPCAPLPDLSFHRLGGFRTQPPELCSRWAGGDPPALSGSPHSVNVLLPVLEATPAWAGGTAVQQTYLRGQGAGTEL